MEPVCEYCGVTDKFRCTTFEAALRCQNIEYWNATDYDMDNDTILATAQDPVVRPTHYTKWKIEPVTFVMRNGMEFWRGNIIKYVSRAGGKLYDGMDSVQSEITDLRKAIRYCEMRINQLEGKVEL